jgi:hypothetical protein
MFSPSDLFSNESSRPKTSSLEWNLFQPSFGYGFAWMAGFKADLIRILSKWRPPRLQQTMLL